MATPAPRRRVQRTRPVRAGDPLRRRSPLAKAPPRLNVGPQAPSTASLEGDRELDLNLAGRVVGEQGGLVQAQPLVVLTGHAAGSPAGVAALLDAGAVIVMASDPEAIRAWLPGAILGHERADVPHAIVRVGRLEVDLTEQRARWLDELLDVSSQELRLLAALGQEPGRVWTFEQLNHKVWGTTFFGGRETIHSAVKRLRRKLAAVGALVGVESIRGVGFRLTGQEFEMPRPEPSVTGRLEHRG